MYKILQKFNKFNKSAHRALIVTDRFVVKMDTKKFKALKEPVLLQNITKISLCSEPNGLIVLHIGDNDILGCTKNAKDEDRIGEMVGTLLAQFDQ